MSKFSSKSTTSVSRSVILDDDDLAKRPYFYVSNSNSVVNKQSVPLSKWQLMANYQMTDNGIDIIIPPWLSFKDNYVSVLSSQFVDDTYVQVSIAKKDIVNLASSLDQLIRCTINLKTCIKSEAISGYTVATMGTMNVVCTNIDTLVELTGDLPMISSSAELSALKWAASCQTVDGSSIFDSLWLALRNQLAGQVEYDPDNDRLKYVGDMDLLSNEGSIQKLLFLYLNNATNWTDADTGRPLYSEVGEYVVRPLALEVGGEVHYLRVVKKEFDDSLCSEHCGAVMALVNDQLRAKFTESAVFTNRNTLGTTPILYFTDLDAFEVFDKLVSSTDFEHDDEVLLVKQRSVIFVDTEDAEVTGFSASRFICKDGTSGVVEGSSQTVNPYAVTASSVDSADRASDVYPLKSYLNREAGHLLVKLTNNSELRNVTGTVKAKASLPKWLWWILIVLIILLLLFSRSEEDTSNNSTYVTRRETETDQRLGELESRISDRNDQSAEVLKQLEELKLAMAESKSAGATTSTQP